jgi:molybdate transport system regulatory protein
MHPALRPGELRIRILHGPEIAMGPGKADLLEAIARTGSISAAGRELGMSYRRAWQLVHTMNTCFREPLVATEKGGARGGGASLTALGEEALARYRKLEALASSAIARDVQAFRKGCLGKAPPPEGR